MKHFLKLISLLFISFIMTSCGGGSGSGSGSDTNKVSSLENDNSLTDELALSLLKGTWRGPLISYVDGTSNKQCEWDVTLQLTETKVSGSSTFIGGVFLGDVAAELISANGENSDKCISDSFSLDWSALCYSDAYKAIIPSIFLANDYTCLHDFDRINSTYLQLYRSKTLSYLLNSSQLSNDKTTIKLKRRNRDSPSLQLKRINRIPI